MRRRALVLVLVSAAGLALSGVAFAGSGGLLPPSPASPNADRISDLYIAIFVVAAVAFLLVEGALVALVVRNRRRGPVGPDTGASASGGRSQLVWTLVPAGVIVALAALTFALLPDITDAPAAESQTAITVEGHQFYWLYRYGDTDRIFSINQLVAPADTVVQLTVTAPADDVVHSWWAPRLGGKIDAVPGRDNETWFKAKPGLYTVRCAELCGIQHARMTGTVRVVPRAEYDKFLATHVSPAALGKQEFEGVCLACHQLDKPLVGPALAGNSALTDRTRLAGLVRDGFKSMPAVGNTWTDAQIDALLAYTKGLSGGQG